MSTRKVDRLPETIVERALPEGGFAPRKGGSFRPDSTAWAVIALSDAGDLYGDVLDAAKKRLVLHQTEQGAVPLLRALPAAYWPTAPVLLAWAPDENYAEAVGKGVDFLTDTRGETFPYSGDPEDGHDSTIVGWPWILDTYAWVVPTSLAMIALEVAGHENNARRPEAQRMLLNRQLPSGGWNYGDTFKFGTELLPFPDTTGVAMSALSGQCDLAQVDNSLRYLDAAVRKTRSPVSLPWAVLGLSAWSMRPADAPVLLEECLSRQEVFGPYETDLLAMVFIALQAEAGLKTLVRQRSASVK